jgi:hypothetical protein
MMGDPTADVDVMRAAAQRIRDIAHPDEDTTFLALATWLESHADIHALRTCDERLVQPCPARTVARAYAPDEPPTLPYRCDHCASDAAHPTGAHAAAVRGRWSPPLPPATGPPNPTRMRKL